MRTTVEAIVPTVRDCIAGLGELNRFVDGVIVADDRPSPAWSHRGSGRVVRVGGRGPAAARNAGAHSAEAAWLYFIDDDDLPLPGLGEVIESLGPTDGLVCGAAIATTGDRRDTRRPEQCDVLGVTVSSLAGTFVVRREVFDACGGYDEDLRFGENTDFIIRAAEAALQMGYVVRHMDCALVEYRRAPDERRYDLRRLRAAEHLLKRGRVDLRTSEARARMHELASVNAVRCGHYMAGMQHAVVATVLVPSPRRLLRVLASMTGPVGRWWWLRRC